MADDDSFESGATLYDAKRPPLPPLLVPIARTSVDRTLVAWDDDIRRAATVAAARSADHRVDEHDLAQAARIQLWRALIRQPDLPDRYVRRVIANALRSARRSARAGLRFEAEEHGLNVADPATVRSIAIDRAVAVVQWIASLPARQRLLYGILYVGGYTQREAAEMLNVSQPRVAQLHQQLLERGRSDLEGIAA